MFTRTLFFTLINITFVFHAADCTLLFSGLSELIRATDNRMITLQSNGGDCIAISRSAAWYSGTLDNIIEDCTVHQIIPIPNFDAQELTLLAHVLNTLNTSESNDAAIKSLRNSFTPDTFELTPKFLKLCYLNDFFNVPVLQKMLLHYIAYAPHLLKDWTLRDRETIALGCEKLQEASNCNDLCHKDRVGLEHLIDIIKDAQLEDKKQFLQSRGNIRGPFFMSVSVGELVAHGIMDTRYKNNWSYDPADVEAHVQYLQNIPMSIDGLICNAAHYITDISEKEQRLRVYNTGISYLPANSFQRVHSPTKLDLLRNRLATIHPEAFAGLHTLQRLHIGNSGTFAQMPVGTLNNLQNLVDLSLSNTSFNPLLLKYCSKLKRLWLSCNQLTEIPAYWPQACASLEHVTIQHNNILSIPTSFFDYFPQLKRLSLAYNNIPHIHADMFDNCKNLTYLSLKKNPIPQEEITALRAALPHVTIEF